MKAITVRQPWAWAIIHAGKDIENRDWPTRLRGRVAVHAAKGMTRVEYEDSSEFIDRIRGELILPTPHREDLIFGAIVGTVEIVDCVRVSESPWFFGKYGFVLRNPEPFAMPRQVTGSLGFWEWNA